MCGICGKYYFDPLKQPDEAIMRRMTASLERRGPDEEARWQEGSVGLGVRRLSIIDPPGGHQPFCSEDGRIRAVYNGQIYNYRHLKDQLISRGHLFLTECDGEVIPHLYEEYGESFLKHLHGMFGLALVDQQKQRLILARDRMGIKPLYYSHSPDGVIFASSVRAILCDPAVSRNFNLAALHCYFSSNYFPGEHTPFSEIKKLLPATFIVCESKKFRMQAYWSLLEKSQADVLPSGSLKDGFNSLFMAAVETHLKADVPVGIFLSGGLDSSCVAYAAATLGADAAAFSIGFQEASFDERPYAALVARRMGIRHHDCLLPEDLGSLLERLGKALDVPTGEPSFLPTYELSAFARKYCKVALSGEGADELLLGYETYLADILARPIFYLPASLRRYIFKQIAKALPVSDTWLNPRQRLEVLLQGISVSKRMSHYAWREVFSAEERNLLLSPACGLAQNIFGQTPYHIFEQYLDDSGSLRYLEQANYFDLKVWLADSVLHRVDMASMHHGLEVRVPFLDDSIVGFTYHLPQQQKMHFLRGKRLLRDAFRGKIPDQIFQRPKHGFSVPVSAWLKAGLKDFFLDTLRASRGNASKIVNIDFVEALHKEHCSGKRDNGRKLWNVMIFLLWQSGLTTS